jgi:hypothetical protein
MSKLSSAQRDRLASGSFVFPKDRSYPIPDATHARNALARVSQFGTASERKAVRDAVSARYPGIKEGKKQ